MKRISRIQSFAAGMILAGSIASAQAGEPVVLTETQMDDVTAGYNPFLDMLMATNRNYNGIFYSSEYYGNTYFPSNLSPDLLPPYYQNLLFLTNQYRFQGSATLISGVTPIFQY